MYIYICMYIYIYIFKYTYIPRPSKYPQQMVDMLKLWSIFHHSMGTNIRSGYRYTSKNVSSCHPHVYKHIYIYIHMYNPILYRHIYIYIHM